MIKKLFFAVACVVAAQLVAAVKLPAVFSDHAVLQKSKKTAIFGYAEPNEKVTVTLGEAKAEGVTNAEGKWKVYLDLSSVEQKAFTLIVKGNDSEARAEDVVVGEVWMCGGQSNMEFVMRKTDNFKEEKKVCGDMMLRYFKVARTHAAKPEKDVKGKWLLISEATLSDCTGVGYYFAKIIREKTHGPVGLLCSYKGGSPIESWMSQELVDTDDEIKVLCQKLTDEIKQGNQKIKDYIVEREAWIKKYNRVDQNKLKAPHEFPTQAFQPVPKNGKLPGGGGAVWIKFKYNGTRVGPGRNFYDCKFYSEGRFLGEFKAIKIPYNRYTVQLPVRNGDKEVLVRMFSPVPIRLEKFVDENLSKLSQVKCEYCFEYQLDDLGKEVNASFPKAAPMVRANVPTRLYNGMIAPILPYTVRGFLWYQGESNSGRTQYYAKEFTMLIKDWRKIFECPDAPFYFCSLAAHHPKVNDPNRKQYTAMVREEQRAVFHAMNNVGQVVLTDAGETWDIHPRDKRTPGMRLALWARRDVYGEPNLAVAGPVAEKKEVVDGKLIVKFKCDGGKLVARPVPEKYVSRSRYNEMLDTKRNSPNSELEGFALCGEDGVWHWADAKIIGQLVEVSSDKVKNPVKVRYNFSDNPTGNLYDEAGLPAEPFEL